MSEYNVKIFDSSGNFLTDALASIEKRTRNGRTIGWDGYLRGQVFDKIFMDNPTLVGTSYTIELLDGKKGKFKIDSIDPFAERGARIPITGLDNQIFS